MTTTAARETWLDARRALGYQLLDLVPKGRDEQDLAWPMAWLHRRDAYPPVP